MADRYRRDGRYPSDDRYSRNSGGYRYSRGNGGRYYEGRPRYGDSGQRDYADYRPARRSSDYERRTDYRKNDTDRSFAMLHAGEEKRGIGLKVIVVFIAFAVVVGNLVLFSILNDVGKKGKGEENVSVPSISDYEDVVKEPEIDVVQVQAQGLLSEMTTEEKIGQLLLIRSGGKGTQAFSELIAQCKVGGIVLFKSDFQGKTKQDVIDMNEAFQTAGGGRLLICVDEEGGTVVRMSSLSALRSERYKSPQDLYKLGGLEEIKKDTVNKCEFLKTYGVNVNFAPVADVVTEKSAFMYKRAFGKNANATGEYVETVVSAMKENQVGSSIKHFPGYGNSKADTHKGLDHNTSSIGTLKASDLVPFEYGIKAGADSIMVTHTIIDDVDPVNPASMSPECLSLIRDYLGFDGVVLTDALDMGAIIEFCNGKDPCVQAFLAGIDMLCLPSDPVKAYNNLLKAVNDGEITQERLDESVMRILKWKIRLGLYEEQENVNG